MGATISITGNLSQTPQLEEVQLSDGPRKICRLNVGYTINRGRNEHNFIEVTTWGDAAENHARYLDKGSPVRIDGELDFQTWPADDGTNRSKHTVINATVEYLGTPNGKTNGNTPAPAVVGEMEEPF